MSGNFAFLKSAAPLCAQLGHQAELYWAEDPVTCLIKLRQFSETLIQQLCAYVGLYSGPQQKLLDSINEFRDQRVLTQDLADILHGLRQAGNRAVHDLQGNHSIALHWLKMARQLAIWFHRSVNQQSSFKAGPFLPPPDPKKKVRELEEQLKKLEEQLEKDAQAQADYSRLLGEARDQAEEATRAARDAQEKARREASERAEWEEFSQSLEAEYQAQLAAMEEKLAAQSAETQKNKDQTGERIARFAEPSLGFELDEAETRVLIDSQLREAGWEVDSEALRYSRGARPVKGACRAIAEWPTASGPADYVLFHGLEVLGVIEAKRQLKDVPGALEQAKRYSRDLQVKGSESFCGQGEYKAPFLFASNGRAFLEQERQARGIWFWDSRDGSISRPLARWYSPEGLKALSQQDRLAALEKLASEPLDYLNLRPYQEQGIKAIEDALRQRQRSLMLAMATGTGKTRTALGLIYRLIKSGFARRVLFVVDRTSLGVQAASVFKSARLESRQPISEIYDFKELGELEPEPETRLQICTIQSLLRRTQAGDSAALPVDCYDVIIVDEAHRGYALDREMSELEMAFRSEAEYISKYRRVLDSFDAIRIGLTATPAAHTTAIFGRPVFSYSYRQAVLDGFLVDHDPPIRIETALSRDGMKWEAGGTMELLRPGSGELFSFDLEDEVELDVSHFNTQVITENFNRVVIGAIADRIDPQSAGKTLVFCANDRHADMVVDLFKQAWQGRGIDDDGIVKITGSADRPDQLILRFKNEAQPKVAVTVDLLTTGIDVPAIVHLVFIRRVRSRILYEQMLGRATRLCPEIGKTCFQIFDAVDLYAALDSVSTMRAVVTNPSISFAELAEHLSSERASPEDQKSFAEQFLAKLRRKLAQLSEEAQAELQSRFGRDPKALADQLAEEGPEALRRFLSENPGFSNVLDSLKGKPGQIIVSTHEDELRGVHESYGTADRPEDYLESFKSFIEEQRNELQALLLVTTRPRDLTRAALKKLVVAFEDKGYKENFLRRAWQATKNQDIAANIIGHIRQQALGSPLLPYSQRVNQALERILNSRDWSEDQKRWLIRIGKQLEKEVVVDQEALDQGQFRNDGGFARLNKIFQGQVLEVLGDFQEEVWKDVS